MKGMKRYFNRHPGYEKHFGIRVDSDGRIADKYLRWIAKNRVMMHLIPEKEQEKEKS
jgi:hypothetical protein